MLAKAFEGFAPSFRKDGFASFEQMHRFGIAENDNLSAIDHSAIPPALQFAPEPIPAQDPFDIAGLSAYDSAFGRGLSGKDMGNPLIRRQCRGWTTGRGGGKDVTHTPFLAERWLI